MNIPKGFKFSGLHCGIKRYRKDIALAYSEKECVTSGFFTTNAIKAAPVLHNIQVLKENSENIRALIVNSKIANSCTGEEGLQNAFKMAKITAQKLHIDSRSVLVASTGIIGIQLPMEKVEYGIDAAVKKLDSDVISFAEAIMTTDTTVKISFRKINVPQEVILLGIAKGSGMIHPNLSTMLAFIFTDAKIPFYTLKELLKKSIDKTYNMIDVDGDMSTNDMVLMFCNGAANVEIKEKTAAYDKFSRALDEINTELAKKIVSDGEGASKVIEVRVANAPDEATAKKVARSICSSNLVKTAIHGADTNWGRIIAAAGSSQTFFSLEMVDLHISDGKEEICVFEKGKSQAFNEENLRRVLSSREIFLLLNMNTGNSSATAWGCDLTEKYIQINGRYKT